MKTQLVAAVAIVRATDSSRAGPDLTPEERDEVKKVARHLLTRLRELFVIEWRDKSQTRPRVQTEIQDLLGAELPRAYSKAIYEARCRALYEHLYEKYCGDGRSAFGGAGGMQ